MDDGTDEDMALLRAHARERGGRWGFGPEFIHLHDPGAAANIIRAFVALDMPVTERPEGDAWGKVVMRLAALEARMGDIETRVPPEP